MLLQDADDDEKEDFDIDMGLGEEAGGPGGSGARQQDEEYVFEVLTTEKIVQNMVDIIKEVNSVMEVSFSLQSRVFKKKIVCLAANFQQVFVLYFTTKAHF